MEIIQYIQIGLTLVGGATIAFRLLLQLTKLTKSDKDDKLVSQILRALTVISGAVALNKDNDTITIKVNNK